MGNSAGFEGVGRIGAGEADPVGGINGVLVGKPGIGVTVSAAVACKVGTETIGVLVCMEGIDETCEEGCMDGTKLGVAGTGWFTITDKAVAVRFAE